LNIVTHQTPNVINVVRALQTAHQTIEEDSDSDHRKSSGRLSTCHCHC